MKWLRARFRGELCRTCDERVKVGQEVGRWGGQWQHRACVEAQLGVVRVLSGETFAGTPSRYRRKVRRR